MPKVSFLILGTLGTLDPSLRLGALVVKFNGMEQNLPDSKFSSPEPSFPTPGTPQADPDLMIDHLSYEEAREYVYRFILAQKATEKSLHQKEQELERWQRRMALAQQAKDPNLVQEAQNRAKLMELEVENLKSEYAQLLRKNAILKEKLEVKARYTPSVDAHQLLAELEMIADVEEHQLRKKFEEKE
ncbi:MAG: hypothetical protein L0Y56_01660, partial [Nitrospira sp.]|nr:hypothetical protein [Nitrospira sp.]